MQASHKGCPGFWAHYRGCVRAQSLRECRGDGRSHSSYLGLQEEPVPSLLAKHHHKQSLEQPNSVLKAFVLTGEGARQFLPKQIPVPVMLSWAISSSNLVRLYKDMYS